MNSPNIQAESGFWEKEWDQVYDYWSKPDSLSDAVNVIEFTAGEVQKDAGALVDEVTQSIETAAMSGTIWLVKGVAIVATLLIAFTSLAAYARTKARKAAK